MNTSNNLQSYIMSTLSFLSNIPRIRTSYAQASSFEFDMEKGLPAAEDSPTTPRLNVYTTPLRAIKVIDGQGAAAPYKVPAPGRRTREDSPTKSRRTLEF
jgi:hypothetical protein